MKPSNVKRFAKAFLAVALTACLASCGYTTAKDYKTGNEMMLHVDEVTITLSDTRRVYCIILDRDTKYQAMSCDWAHADGSDNL